MPCYQPTRVLSDRQQTLQWGKDWRNLYDGESVVNIPCRKCIGCQEGQKRDWSVRCFHEALMHSHHWTDPDTKITTEIPNSSIVTLTYNDEHLPADGCLHHEDFQRFMKRLRKRRSDQADTRPVRYFMCGEYGGKSLRSHFHAIIFGESFDDRYSVVEGNKTHQMSYELDSLWTQSSHGRPPSNMGRATVDSFSFAGAAYVAGYVAKKITSGQNGPMEDTFSPDGVRVIRPIAAEYRKMSTGRVSGSGLGGPWILKPENLAAVYSEDCVKISNWTFHPPRYYDTLFKRTDPLLWADILENRLDGQSKTAEEWSPERCASAELLALSNLQLRRDSL